jgi:hypothetical protein
MRFFLCLASCVLCLVSCQNNQNQIPVVGSFDSSAIALDTVMQKGFESSYEFHKTLTVNEKLVFDVVAYGGPASKGEFAILRRGADNKSDTVMKEIRDGVIADAFFNKNELNIVIKNPADTLSKKIFSYPVAADKIQYGK